MAGGSSSGSSSAKAAKKHIYTWAVDKLVEPGNRARPGQAVQPWIFEVDGDEQYTVTGTLFVYNDYSWDNIIVPWNTTIDGQLPSDSNPPVWTIANNETTFQTSGPTRMSTTNSSAPSPSKKIPKRLYIAFRDLTFNYVGKYRVHITFQYWTDEGATQLGSGFETCIEVADGYATSFSNNASRQWMDVITGYNVNHELRTRLGF